MKILKVITQKIITQKEGLNHITGSDLLFYDKYLESIKYLLVIYLTSSKRK
jgi:hypothetical protein